MNRTGRKLKLEDEVEEAESDCEEDMESSELLNGAVPTGEHNDIDQSFSSDESDGFIVEDDGVFQLPPQFSMETHQDLSLQFKKIFQFFVHVAVQPAAARGAYMEQQMQGSVIFYEYTATFLLKNLPQTMNTSLFRCKSLEESYQG